MNAPHGTAAAYRKHYRDGEKPCAECWQADRDRKRKPPDGAPDFRTGRVLGVIREPAVNGAPEPGGYRWRSRPHRWADQVLRRAEDRWGAPPAG